ncbi:hypothetical protein VTG60DRAFT_3984 [Thermothelomyces hinnuleus]
MEYIGPLLRFADGVVCSLAALNGSSQGRACVGMMMMMPRNFWQATLSFRPCGCSARLTNDAQLPLPICRALLHLAVLRIHTLAHRPGAPGPQGRCGGPPAPGRGHPLRWKARRKPTKSCQKGELSIPWRTAGSTSVQEPKMNQHDPGCLNALYSCRTLSGAIQFHATGSTILPGGIAPPIQANGSEFHTEGIPYIGMYLIYACTVRIYASSTVVYRLYM